MGNHVNRSALLMILAFVFATPTIAHADVTDAEIDAAIEQEWAQWGRSPAFQGFVNQFGIGDRDRHIFLREAIPLMYSYDTL